MPAIATRSPFCGLARFRGLLGICPAPLPSRWQLFSAFSVGVGRLCALFGDVPKFLPAPCHLRPPVTPHAAGFRQFASFQISRRLRLWRT